MKIEVGNVYKPLTKPFSLKSGNVVITKIGKKYVYYNYTNPTRITNKEFKQLITSVRFSSKMLKILPYCNSPLYKVINQ